MKGQRAKLFPYAMPIYISPIAYGSKLYMPPLQHTPKLIQSTNTPPTDALNKDADPRPALPTDQPFIQTPPHDSWPEPPVYKPLPFTDPKLSFTDFSLSHLPVLVLPSIPGATVENNLTPFCIVYSSGWGWRKLGRFIIVFVPS